MKGQTEIKEPIDKIKIHYDKNNQRHMCGYIQKIMLYIKNGVENKKLNCVISGFVCAPVTKGFLKKIKKLNQNIYYADVDLNTQLNILENDKKIYM